MKKNIDIANLPSDIRSQYKRLKVMHAEKKFSEKQKMTLCLLLKLCGQSLLKARTTEL